MAKQLKWYSFRWHVGAAILAALVLCAGLTWYSLRQYRQPSMGSGPAGPAVSLDAFRQVWHPGKVLLLGLGDSITAGYGSTDGRGYFGLLVSNDDKRHPDMAGRDLSSVFPKLETANHSVSGSTSIQHLSGQVPSIERQPADVRGVVVISSGGNDIIHNYGRSEPTDGAMYGCTYEQASQWKESFRERLVGIIEGVNAKFPGGCEIFMANVYDPTDGGGDIEGGRLGLPPWPDGLRVHRLFNQVIADTCASYANVNLVDIHSVMLGHGIHCRDRRNPYFSSDDPHFWYFMNLEDPNDRGYDAIRRVFLLKMIEVLRPGDALAVVGSDSGSSARPQRIIGSRDQ